MTHRFVRPKIVIGLVCALVASSAFIPMAEAQTQLNVKSVGEIFVDASGRASGQNVATAIHEAKGVLEAYTATALGAELFSSVSIDGFAQAEKIQGVGSSAILLRGSNAVVSVYDNINSEFRIQATQATGVHYSLSKDIVAKAQSSARNVIGLYTTSGNYLGSLVLVGANGAASGADAIAVAEKRVDAKLSAGSQVVWSAEPVYVEAADYHDAVVAALAKGHLSAKIVTELEGSAEAQSKVDYFSNVASTTRAAADSAIETDVQSRAEASTMIAYDLAYESLPAQSADDVAVYADGELAARAETAAEVSDYAAAGLASYYATVENGRTQVLASTPSFKSSASHRMTLVARADASSEAQARADYGASADSRATGSYEYHSNGKLTGHFTTGILAEKDAAIHDFIALDTKTQVFKSVRMEGTSKGYADIGEQHATIAAPQADLTVVDDLYATLLVDAKSQATAVFNLGANVKATQESANVVRLTGPNGFAGALIAAGASANAQGHSSARFDPPSADSVKAKMEPGSRVVFRSESQAKAHASEQVVTKGIAAGQIGAHVLAGIQGNLASANAVSYSPTVDTRVVSAARGSYQIDYSPNVVAPSPPQVVVFDSRGLALAAKHAADVQVLVNGKAATAVNAPHLALDSAGGAKYYVDTSLEGHTRVIVNTATSAHQKAKIDLTSRLDAVAKAKANTDSFGIFKLFYDGTAVGSFVSLKTDQKAGVVNDFTMISTGQTIFSSIQAGASAFVSAGAEGASQLLLENRESQIEFTDTTSAYMRVVAEKSTTANFNLAPDIRAEQRSATVVELTSSTGQHLGSMIITDVEGKAAAASSFQTDADHQVKAKLEQGAQVVFRTHVGIEAELSAAQRTMINHAIASGKVAGQVLVQSQASLSAVAHAQASAKAHAAANARSNLESTSASAFDSASTAVSAIEASGRVTTAVTASYYNDVQMVTAATQNRVDLTISSATTVGKTVIVSLDPATIPGMSTGDAEILVDGKAAAQASSYADILDPSDDFGAYEYFVLAGEAGTQVLVSMPHFSTHTVTLKERETSASHVFMYATIFLGVLVAAETAYLVRRRNA